MELKSLEEGFFFLCGRCSQFPEIAVECNLCYQVYCFTCKQYLHLQEKRGCYCSLTNHEILQPFQQFVYDRLTIKCLLCTELIPLNKMKKHKIKCQNKISKLQFNNINEIQMKTFYTFCQMNRHEQLDTQNFRNMINISCQKCHVQQYSQRSQNLSEDSIIQLKSAVYQCQLCQYEEHHLLCKQEVVECICGSKIKRNILKNHINLCMSEEITKYQNQKEQISSTINLQYIAFHQQLLQNRHVSKIIKTHNQFQGFNQDFETWDEY
ncbi:hypothetical protein pb186bvf_009939 [Paramecium bursaria]